MVELLTRDNKINLLVISDLHLCNKKDRIDLLYKAYSYANKNDIKYVINLGDLIDSVMPHNKEEIKYKSVGEQINYVIDNYPLNSNIKTYILYGNHDYYSKYNNNYDIRNLIHSKRKDFVDLGYGETLINVLNNPIKLSHEIDYLKNYKTNIDTVINFIGHTHNYKIKCHDDLKIYVPTLSDLSPQKELVRHGILDVTLSFDEDIISNINIKNIDIENNILNNEFDMALSVSEKKYRKILEKIKNN